MQREAVNGSQIGRMRHQGILKPQASPEQSGTRAEALFILACHVAGAQRKKRAAVSTPRRT